MKRVDDNCVSMITCFLLSCETGAEKKRLLGRKGGRRVKTGTECLRGSLGVRRTSVFATNREKTAVLERVLLSERITVTVMRQQMPLWDSRPLHRTVCGEES